MQFVLENVGKHRGIKLVIKEARKDCLASELNSHAKHIINITLSFFFKNFIGHRRENMQIFINKPVYLGLSVLELSKIAMYKFGYDYVKLKTFCSIVLKKPKTFT